MTHLIFVNNAEDKSKKLKEENEEEKTEELQNKNKIIISNIFSLAVLL